MSQISSLLDKMRDRLAMYVGTDSLTKLAAYLRGYDCALKDFAPAHSDAFLPEFRDWIQRRYQTTRLSWEEAILQGSADESDAVNRFWHLLEEFRAEHERNGNTSKLVGTKGKLGE